MEQFDPESGLVFRETIVKAQRPPAKWEHRLGSSLGVRYKPPAKGAESLYAKAMREIVRKAYTLTPESLQAIPTTIAQQIWKAIRRE